MRGSLALTLELCSSTTAASQSHALRAMCPAGTAWPLTLRQVSITHMTSPASPSSHLRYPTGDLVTLNPSIAIPSLKLDLRVHMVEFGGAGGTNVRPIVVLDQTQKFTDLVRAPDSNGMGPDSSLRLFTRGTLLSDRIPIGTADGSTRLMPDAFAPPPYVRDLHTSIISSLSAVHRGEPSFISDIFATPFFPHVSTLVVTLPRHQLKDLSPCQLQLTLVNSGQFIYMNHTENRPAFAPIPSHIAMTTLDINPRVPKHFPDKSVTEMFSMQIEMSGERWRAFVANQGLSSTEAASSEFNNYRFSVNYLPRTNFSVQNYSCPIEPQFSLNYAKVLSPLEPSSASVHVSNSSVYPLPPFRIVLYSTDFDFVVEVAAIKTSSL